MPRYSFGICVRAKLRKLHRTQRELAHSLGYSASYISMVLSGRFPAPDLRRRITDQLNRWGQEG